MGCIGKGFSLIIVLLIVLVLFIFAGAVYETRAESAVAAQYPAPGQIVEVDSRNMHVQCLGEGSPTIILDAGQGGWSSDWANIMFEISASNRVCAYDRAGYGWSDPADDSRSPQDAADDLVALLSAAQVEPPIFWSVSPMPGWPTACLLPNMLAIWLACSSSTPPPNMTMKL